MNPIIEYQKRENERLYFNISNVNVSIANSIRRVVLSEIPTVVFRTFPESENKCTIHSNTSRLNNEIIKQRLSCIPIHVSDLSKFDYKNYKVILDVENESENIKIVTSNDFQVLDTVKNEKLSKDEVKELFPSYSTPNGEYYIDILRLRPGHEKVVANEKIYLECDLDIGTSKENGMFNVVSVCSYGFKEDLGKQQNELQKKKQQWKDENKNIDEEESNWKLLDGKRCFVENSFDFVIKSIGINTEFEILNMSIEILMNKLKIFHSKIEKDELIISESQTTIENSFDITIDDSYGDYTIGKAVEFVLYDKYYNGLKILSFCGFIKFHPHDKTSCIRIAYKNSNDISVKQNLLEVIKDLSDIYTKIKVEIKKLEKR